MNCDTGKAREGLGNELWCRWSNWKLGEWAELIVIIIAELILQAFHCFTYVTTHSPTLPSLYLHQSSFSNPFIASPMSQLILQPFFGFSYVTGFSLTSPGEPPMNQLYLLNVSGSRVLFAWIPGHFSIPGNENADKAAKEAVHNATTQIPFVPASDLKSFLWREILMQWNDDWLTSTTKLCLIKSMIWGWLSSSCSSCLEEVIIARVRIGQCLFSHVHVLRSSPAPICDTCGEPLSVQHLILQCRRLDCYCRTLALPGTIQEALGNDIHVLNRVLCFLKQRGYYSKI